MAAETCSWIQAREIVFFISLMMLQKCSYGLKISRNIEINCLFPFESYFHVIDTFHTSYVDDTFKMFHFVQIPLYCLEEPLTEYQGNDNRKFFREKKL